MHGRQDDVAPVDSGRALHAAAPRAEPLSILEGAGHTLGATHPMGRPGTELTRALETTVDWLALRVGDAGDAPSRRA